MGSCLTRCGSFFGDAPSKGGEAARIAESARFFGESRVRGGTSVAEAAAAAEAKGAAAVEAEAEEAEAEADAEAAPSSAAASSQRMHGIMAMGSPRT